MRLLELRSIDSDIIFTSTRFAPSSLGASLRSAQLAFQTQAATEQQTQAATALSEQWSTYTETLKIEHDKKLNSLLLDSTEREGEFLEMAHHLQETQAEHQVSSLTRSLSACPPIPPSIT